MAGYWNSDISVSWKESCYLDYGRCHLLLYCCSREKTAFELWWTHDLFHLIITTDSVAQLGRDVIDSVHKITFASLDMDDYT